MSVPDAEEITDPAITTLLDRSEYLMSRPRRIDELMGGLTNRNFKVVTPDGQFVARVSSTQGDLLAIDRDNEYRNTMAAAEAGVGAPVVDYHPGAGLLVIGFLPGKTCNDADLSDMDTLHRVARSCRALHAGPRFVNRFSMFDTQPQYLNIVGEQELRLPDRYLDFLPQVERMRAALRVRDEGTVPCNNDLLAENFIDDGDKIWIIDYEYAGNNDPCFELGNIWSEASLPLEHLGELVSAYYGRPLRHKLARARLLGLMSKYGWTLWASIQAGTSAIDFDFWSWGMEKYERAVAEFDSSEFDQLLEDVQRED